MAPTTKNPLSITTVASLPGSSEPIIPGLGEPYVSRAVHAWERPRPTRASVPVPTPEAPEQESRCRSFFEGQARAKAEKAQDVEAKCLDGHPELPAREAFCEFCKWSWDLTEGGKQESESGSEKEECGLEKFPDFDGAYACRLLCEDSLTSMPPQRRESELVDRRLAFQQQVRSSLAAQQGRRDSGVGL